MAHLTVDMADLRHVRYERPLPAVARIVMARPAARNAQSNRMTYELNAAFNAAVSDERVRAIVLAADDPHFSAGHDLSETFEEQFETVGTWSDFWAGGPAGRFAHESEIFLEMCERWRNLSKPIIAAVQGKCIAGGLMLAWACDLILASDDASFRDPTLMMGVLGAEYFMHPWELGTRQAKEFLWTSEWMGAERAHQLGMVNRVLPRQQLQAEALHLAEEIAKRPAFAVRATKLAVNAAQDQQGRWNAIRHSFALHHLTHANNEHHFGVPTDPSGTTDKVGSKMLNANVVHQGKAA